MLKKFTSIIIISFFLLTGCNEGEGKEYDITGINLGASHHGGVTLFVEDNINGQKVELSGYHFENFDTESYEVEAYHLLFNQETKVIADRTGEKVSLEEEDYNGIPFHHPYLLWNIFLNDIAVKTVEEFEPKVLTDREYILWERTLLPAYTAEEIRVFPVSFEDFLTETAVQGEDNVLHVMMVTDRIKDYEEFYVEHDEMYQELAGYSRGSEFYVSYGYLEHDDWKLFNEPLETDAFPVYYITDETGIIQTVTDKEKVFEFLDNTLDR
ncbi:hypothetical protein MM300_14160 [Evansella sp. LMS18]|jgi:hypothetical protein|uniref:hypothetical protein n=1 Tax=Evansella sp. LMS18 TaxID=2924033 RepID=UPI0020D1E52A|nr:hypothetical protein [Evansella sp. LMS18]UTR09064.1 hypothetical protein MM300_14160 [Evansella sp. LMS18]